MNSLPSGMIGLPSADLQTRQAIVTPYQPIMLSVLRKALDIFYYACSSSSRCYVNH